MKNSRGVAYCGLACAICDNKACIGCKNEGCSGANWCKNFKCCSERGLNGCWECEEFPCKGGMLDKLKIRTFAKFIKVHGEEEFIKCLKKNEGNGIVYHYKGEFVGDYDKGESEEEILRMIEEGI